MHMDMELMPGVDTMLILTNHLIFSKQGEWESMIMQRNWLLVEGKVRDHRNANYVIVLTLIARVRPFINRVSEWRFVSLSKSKGIKLLLRPLPRPVTERER